MATQTMCRPVETDEDRERLVVLLREYEEWLPPDLRHKQIVPASRTGSLARSPNRAWLAYADDVTVGCVAAIPVDEATLSLHHLYVRESARGLGLGRALIAAVIDYALENAYARVVLDTERTRLASAYALYCTLGFRECAPFGTVTYDDATFMELRLESARA